MATRTRFTSGCWAVSETPAVWVWKRSWVERPVVIVTLVIYTIPSIALFELLVPIHGLGLSVRTAEVALVSYTLLILFRNTLTGLREVPEEVRDAARSGGPGSRHRRRPCRLDRRGRGRKLRRQDTGAGRWSDTTSRSAKNKRRGGMRARRSTGGAGRELIMARAWDSGLASESGVAPGENPEAALTEAAS